MHYGYKKPISQIREIAYIAPVTAPITVPITVACELIGGIAYISGVVVNTIGG